MSARPVTRPSVGRPVATTHGEIEQAAFALFERLGFERTTVDAIAAEVGVGRRTLFRYYESKNDIPWGQFAETLDGFRAILADSPPDLPVHAAVHRGVLAFNAFDLDARPSHRVRMGLILHTPALQAHSVLKFAAWRDVIAEFVADRTGASPDDLAPRTVGHVSLALAVSAYEAWLADESADLHALLDDAMGALRDHLAN